MYAEDHKTEAERLLRAGKELGLEIARETHGREANGFSVLQRYADLNSVYLAAQVHATLALYREPPRFRPNASRTSTEGEETR